jgi:FkbM family methyltransferase
VTALLNKAVWRIRQREFIWATRMWISRQINGRRAGRRLAAWERRGEGVDPVVHVGDSGLLSLPRDSELSRLIVRGDFELDEQCFARAFLRPGDSAVDVGANIGLYSVLMADAVGPEGRVYAFEPNPETHARLVQNVALNKFTNVECSAAALSDSCGTAELSAVLGGWDAYSTLGVADQSLKVRRIVVRTDTWNEFARAEAIDQSRIRLVKIDAEGWEEFVLRGATDLLSGSDALVVQLEVNEGAAEKAGSSVTAVVEVLRDHGYALWGFSRLRRRLLPYSPTRLGYSGIVYAVRDRDAVERRIAPVLSWRRSRPNLGLW